MAKKRKATKIENKSTEIKDEVRHWYSRISRAEQRLDQQSKKDGWIDLQRAFKGELSAMLDELSLVIDPRIKIPAINLLWAIIKTDIASISLKNPHFEVNPTKGSTILSAKIRELALNHIWRHKRMKREIDKCLQDTETVGHSWFKVGYTGKFKTVEDGNGYVMEFVESEDFFGYRVSWKDIAFSSSESIDPPHDLRWISHRVYRPLEDVQKNEAYKKSVRDQLVGSPLESESDSVDDVDSFTKWVKLYEVHDIANGKKFVLAEGADDYLQDPTDYTYDLRGTHFSFLAFNPINDQAYPIPEAKMYIDQILNHIKIRFQQLDHLKRANRQYDMPKGYLDPERKSDLSLGITGAIHETNRQPGTPSQIELIGSPTVSVDSYPLEQRNLDDLGNMAGQDPSERGGSARTSTRALGEIIERQRGAKNRRADKIAKLEEFLTDIARNLLSLIMQFGDEPFYVKLTGKEPAELMQELSLRPSAVNDPENAVTDQFGFTFTKEDIQGEFDVSVKPGSTIELDRETKLELIQQIATFAPQLIQTGGPVAAAFGRIFAEELEWPELAEAVEKEIQLSEAREAKAEARAQELAQIQAAQFGAEKQLEAEKIQSKNTGDLIKFATTAVNASGGRNGSKEPSN